MGRITLFLIFYVFSQQVVFNVRLQEAPQKIDSLRVVTWSGSGELIKLKSLNGLTTDTFSLSPFTSVSRTALFWDWTPTFAMSHPLKVTIFRNIAGVFSFGSVEIDRPPQSLDRVQGTAPVDLDDDGFPEGMICDPGAYVEEGMPAFFNFRFSRLTIQTRSNQHVIGLKGPSLITRGNAHSVVLGNKLFLPEHDGLANFGIYYFFRGVVSMIGKTGSSIARIPLSSFELPRNHSPLCFVSLKLNNDEFDDLLLVSMNGSNSELSLTKFLSPDYDEIAIKYLNISREQEIVLDLGASCLLEDVNFDRYPDLKLALPAFEQGNDEFEERRNGVAIVHLLNTSTDFVLGNFYFINLGQTDRVSLIDVDGNGSNEAIVSTKDAGNPNSGQRYVLTYSGTGYSVIRQARMNPNDEEQFLIDPYAVPGVKVVLGGKTAFTDINGQARFYDVPAGVYPVTLVHRGFNISGPSVVEVGPHGGAFFYRASRNTSNDGGSGSGNSENGGNEDFGSPSDIFIKVNKKFIELRLPIKHDVMYVFDTKLYRSNQRPPKNFQRRMLNQNIMSIRKPRSKSRLIARGAYKKGQNLSTFTRAKSVIVR
ncbi:MAG: carboxypeptidase-like regulatory domain-containing protein [Deltaproteobacteria bacterium]|nr:carboxypeptidase-like regulatory domain-containing protein [Deltaproteobacteria bacterium]